MVTYHSLTLSYSFLAPRSLLTQYYASDLNITPTLPTPTLTSSPIALHCIVFQVAGTLQGIASVGAFDLGPDTKYDLVTDISDAAAAKQVHPCPHPSPSPCPNRKPTNKHNPPFRHC